MLVGIDHVIVACADPDSAADSLEEALGLRVGGGGRHEAHGTFNRLFWLGDSYVELMGVFDEGLAGESWWGRHALEVIARGGGYMGIAIATNAVQEDGQALGAPERGERVRADGRVVRWDLAHAATPDEDLGLAFLIEHDESGAEWAPADRAARAADNPGRLMRVELTVRDVGKTTMRLLRDLRLQFRPSLVGGGARDTSIGSQTLRLVPGRGSVAPRVVIRAGDESRAVSALGVEWRLERALG